MWRFAPRTGPSYVSECSMYPFNHKTIFVLDHTPYFGISCESFIDFDINKTRGPGFIPVAPISKSLWTCSVEAAIEYCRIVWDLFPEGKLIRFIVSDSHARVLNSWNQQEQNIHHILSELGLVGIPPRHTSGDMSVVPGLRVAVEALCECSNLQHERRTTLSENAPKVLNRCRVICIMSARDDSSMTSLEEIFQGYITQQNKKAASSDSLIPIHQCHLVIINIIPNNSDSAVMGHPLKEVSNLLSTEVHSVRAGVQFASKMSSLILHHYELGSTTVTGIPMKEEQNANSSANYDVEILHSATAHASALKGNPADIALICAERPGCDYQTVTLKWCTPRGYPTEMLNCVSMHRITPVDVNSRPSSCLINFLLNGRSVMLEMPRKSGGKMMSHYLASHGGEIFIHTLVTSRSVLEDPPSISEGCGGRVTDYRIPDLGLLMQKNKLIPLKGNADMTSSENTTIKMRTHLDRQTKYWPITISSTFIYNLKSYLEPLPTLIMKETLTDEEVNQCKQVIYNIISLESKHEPLQIPNLGQRGKGPKREEQYRVLWNEMETLLSLHCRSDQHSQVLNCLRESRTKADDDKNSKSDKKDDKMETDQIIRELDQSGKFSEVQSPETTRATVIRATTDSPMSPPPVSGSIPLVPSIQRTSDNDNMTIYDKPRSMLEWFQSRTNNNKEKRPEFHGRTTGVKMADGGMVTKLYPYLKEGDRAARDIPIEGESNDITNTPKSGS